MVFMKGPAPWRRTIEYLEAGRLIFQDKVKIFSINYHDTLPESEGLKRFIFWHLAQIQYKNPQVQCIHMKNFSPTPYITVYQMDTDKKLSKIFMNCYKQKENEILERCIEIVGKTREQLERAQLINRANFGENCKRFCICEVPGQISCPSFKQLPEFMTGKYQMYKKDELEELRKTKPDEIALKEYWEKA